jgi:hypothetical protein
VNLRDKVLAPLGMNRTLFLPAEVLADGDYALGKTVDGTTGEPKVAHPDTYDNSWARPAGYAFSSVLDMAKFVRFLVQGNTSVLNDRLLNEMKAPRVNTQNFLDRDSYGYGIGRTRGLMAGVPPKFYEVEVFGHSGAIPGFSSELYYAPSCGTGFIALANADGVSFAGVLCGALIERCQLQPATPPDVSENPSNYHSYAGDYLDPFLVGAIKLSHVGNDLQVSMPALDSVNVPYDKVLKPIMLRNFLLTIQGEPTPVTIILDDRGKGKYIRTRSVVGIRDAAAPAPGQAPTAAALLARFRSARRTERSLVLPLLAPALR